MSSRTPTLGFAIYRALDGVSDLACIITQVEGWEVTITVFPPMKPPMYYNRIKFDPQAGPDTAAPGTCYRW
jgi:hypothetical protein